MRDYDAFTWANLVAQSAWTRLLRLSLVDAAAMNETDVTRTILVDSLGGRRVSAVLSGTRGLRTEAKSGADLEVYFASGGRGFGWRIQAKRLRVSKTRGGKCRYTGINQIIGGSNARPPKVRQIDQLISAAARDRLAAWYWFYNTSIPGCGCLETPMACGVRIGCIRCHQMSHDLVENGVIAAPAPRIKARLGTSSHLDVETAMRDSFHLRCLLDDRGLGRSNGEFVVRELIRQLHELEALSDGGVRDQADPTSTFTGRTRADLNGDAIPLLAIPEELASFNGELALDARPRVDQYLAERRLFGALVISFD